MTAEQIARVCHEANRGYQAACPAEGIPVAPPWDDCHPRHQSSVIAGVKAVLDGATPEEGHANWCRLKLAEGWVYGPVKDPDAKTHPCLLPYGDLPPEQQYKDHLFSAIVRALA